MRLWTMARLLASVRHYDDTRVRSLVWKARMSGKVRDMSPEELEQYARAQLAAWDEAR